MKQIFSIIAFLITSISINAQIGISGGYKTFKAEEWTDLINTLTEENFEDINGYSVGIDYWFRLKNIRLEFFPTVSWTALKSSTESRNFEMSLLGIHLNTNIYPFDLKGDCDCPTWSKSGGLFQKGFFIQASPGYVKNTLKIPDHPTNIQDYDMYYFEFGVGAGLDIGVSDLLTLTPLFRYQYAPNVEYTPSSDSLIDFGPTKSNLNQWFAGVRIGLRFDE